MPAIGTGIGVCFARPRTATAGGPLAPAVGTPLMYAAWEGPFWTDTARTTPADIDDPVRAWDDLSGNGRHLLLPAGRPAGLLQAAPGSGHYQWAGEGGGECLAASGVDWDSGPHTVFVVATVTSPPSIANTGFCAAGPVPAGSRLAYYAAETSGFLSLLTTETALSPSAVAAVGDPACYSFRSAAGASGGSIAAARVGRNTTFGDTAAGVGGITAAAGFVLARGSDVYFAGAIRFAAVFGEYLSDGQVTTLVNQYTALGMLA